MGLRLSCCYCQCRKLFDWNEVKFWDLKSKVMWRLVCLLKIEMNFENFGLALKCSDLAAWSLNNGGEVKHSDYYFFLGRKLIKKFKHSEPSEMAVGIVENFMCGVIRKMENYISNGNWGTWIGYCLFYNSCIQYSVHSSFPPLLKILVDRCVRHC